MDTLVNRAEELWQNWERKEAQLCAVEEMAQEHPVDITWMKYAFLKEGLFRLDHSPSRHEKLYRDMIGVITDKLQKQLYPNPVLRFLEQVKLAVYDKPKYLKAHQELVAGDLIRLKNVFSSRGLDAFAHRLEYHLDYERDKVSIPISGQIDANRTVFLHQHLEKDGRGNYQLSTLDASLHHDADHTKNISVSFDEKFKLNNVQLGNLLQGRAVYLFHDKSLELPKESWIQLGRDLAYEEIKVNEYGPAYGYNLKKELENLAIETGLFRMTASDILHELKLGNPFQFTGHHPKDKPFLLQADPGLKSLKITDPLGKEISKEILLKSLRHVLPQVNKEAELSKNKERPMDKKQSQQNEQQQGLGL